MSSYIEYVSECVQIPKEKLEQLRAELATAQKRIAELESDLDKLRKLRGMSKILTHKED